MLYKQRVFFIHHIYWNEVKKEKNIGNRDIQIHINEVSMKNKNQILKLACRNK